MESTLTKKIRLLDIKVSKLINNSFFGNYRSAFKWKWIEFADLREYEIWDDAKDIDWNVSAKSWKVFIKKYIESRELCVLFVMDVGASMKFGSKTTTKLDTMLYIFYTLALSAIKNNDKIGTVLYDNDMRYFFNPKKGKSFLSNSIYNVYKNINSSQLIDSDVSSGLKLLNNLNYKNTMIFIITDDIYEQVPLEMKLLSWRNQIVYINVFDSFENTLLDSSAWVNLINDGSDYNISISDDIKKSQYIEFRQNKINLFKKNLLANNIDYLCVDETSDIYKELLNYFKYKMLNR